MNVRRIRKSLMAFLLSLSLLLVSASIAVSAGSLIEPQPITVDPLPESISPDQVNSTETTPEDGGTDESALFDFEAFVKEADVRDGTAPFDVDNAAGNDAGDQNGIVRTFDTLTYPVKITINPKNVDKLNNIVLRITGTLENGVVDNRVNAKFSVGGYEDIATQTVGFEQLYTIKQTGNSVMIPISIDVQAAKNGVVIKPVLKVEVISVDGVDTTKDSVKMDFNELKSITTSGKVNMQPYVGGGFTGTGIPYYPYAGISDNVDDMENVQAFGLSFGVKNLANKSDNKGSTLPSGKINYHIELSSEIYWSDGPNAGDIIALDYSQQDTPVYLLDQRPISGNQTQMGAKNTLMQDKEYRFAYSDAFEAPLSDIPDLSLESILENSYNSVWDSGTWAVNEPVVGAKSVIYTGSTENYIIGSTFPEYRSDGYTGSALFGQNDKVFSSNAFLIKMPNEYTIGGKNNPMGYANNVYYDAKIVLDSYVNDAGKTIAVNRSRTWYASERNNPDGSYSLQNTFFSPLGSQLGTYNSGWREVSKGDASTILGTDVLYGSSLGSSSVSYGGYDALYAWNPDAFELTKAYAQEAREAIYQAGYYSIALKKQANDTTNQKVFYGVSKTADHAFAVLTKKGVSDYNWFDAFDQAQATGAVSAMRTDVFAPTGPTWTDAVEIPLHVKTTKIGSVNEKGTANIIVTHYYPYADKARKNRIDVYGDADYNTPAVWSEAGQLIVKQAPVGNSVNFETLAILNAALSNKITSDKQTYYNSESVDWLVESSLVLPPTGGPDNYDGTVQIKQVLPKGLDYTAGTGLYGTLKKEPKVTKNADGTTDLLWDVVVSKSNTIDDVQFTTTINPFALTSGVQSALTVKTVISSVLDKRDEPLRTSTRTISILKVGMVGIYETIDKLSGEKNSAFALTMQPYTTIDEEWNVKGITVLPQTGDKTGSVFTGTALLKKIEVTGSNPVTIYLNNSVIQTSDPHKVDLTKDGWYKYTGAGQNISNAKTVLFHVDGILANTDNVGVVLTMQTADNQFGDVYASETTINSATDYTLSPISNKVRYTIRAEAELALERIQIYTANATNGLPIAVRVDKDLLKSTAVDESVTLAVYNKETNTKVTSLTVTLGDLLRETKWTIPSSGLVKDQNIRYEVRLEGYNTNRIYVVKDAAKVDTLGYTASEKLLEATVSSTDAVLSYTGVVMTERTVGQEALSFKEWFAIPLHKDAPVIAGYGVMLNQKLGYLNELGLDSVDDFKLQAHVDERILDGDFYTAVDHSVALTLESDSQTEAGARLYEYKYPHTYVALIDGVIASGQTALTETGLIKNEYVDGGNKLYTPVWVDDTGTYTQIIQSTQPMGVNDVSLKIMDPITVNGFLFSYIGSETADVDALLMQPASKGSTVLWGER